MTSGPKISGNPYIGPRTFRREQGRLFFGREREARDLAARVMSERLLLFYAQSGAGKSSLINARLIPSLQKNGYAVLPVARVSGDLPSTVQAVDNIFLFNLMTSLLDKNAGDPTRFARLSLKEFLAGLSSDDGATFTFEPDTADEPEPEQPATPTPYVLILDQFEEIVTAHPGRWQERTAFFTQLNQALLDDPNLWVLMTLREDYVAALDPYKPLMFNRLHATFFMERMAEAAALDAVRRPAELGGRPFAAGVAEKLVDDLLQVRVPGQETTIKGQYVEPVQLQVVCYQLWQTLTANAPLWQASDTGKKQVEITFEDLAKAGDVNQALKNFYDDTLQDTLRELQEASIAGDVGERQLRSWFEDELITEAGTRGLMRQDDDKTGTLPNAVVKKLQLHFLVRSETRSGDTWFELIHDRFVEPVRSSNLGWKQQRRREQPWIDAAYGWHESGDSPEKRNAGLLLADLNLKTVLADTTGQQFEPVVMEYLDASIKAQEERDQAARLGAAQRDKKEADRRATEAQTRAELAERLEEVERKRADLQTESNRKLRRRAIALAALAGGVFALLLLVGVLALNLKTEGDAVEDRNTQLGDQNITLEISRTQLAEQRDRANQAEGAARTAQMELQSVTLSRIVSRLDLNSEDQRQFALLLGLEAMTISPTLQAESASIEALDAAYRQRSGWQPGVTPTMYFTQALTLPFSDPMTMTLRRDGEAVAAVVAGPAVVVALDPSAWVTQPVTTSFARIDALALSDDGRLIAVAGCGQRTDAVSGGDGKSPAPDAPNSQAGDRQCGDWRIEILPISSQSQFSRRIPLDQTVGGVKALVFHPFLFQLVAATEDESLLHWHLSASEPAAQQVSATLPRLVDLSTSADGKYLSALDAQGRNRVWGWGVWDSLGNDWPSDLKANTYQSVAFVRDGKWFATGSNCPAGQDANKSGDRCPAVRLWEKNTQVPIGRPILVGAAIVDLGYDEQSHTLNLLQRQQLVRWDLNPQDWPELVCQRAGRTMTFAEWEEAFPNSKVEDYESACAYPLHNSFVQARIAEAEKKLDDCTPQGRKIGWDLLDYPSIPRLPTAVTILVEQALARFEENQADLSNPATACLEQANALLADEDQETIPLDVAMETARRLLGAEGRMASEPEIATGELEVVQEQLAQWSVDLDSRLAKDYLTLCFDQGFLDACSAAQDLSANTLMTFGETKSGEILQGNEGTPWYFYGQRGQAVTVAMDAVGDSFDTILYLDGSGGRVELAGDDDSGDGYNSLIKDFVVAEDGMYRIRPQALSGSGAYRLTLQQGRTLPRIAVGEPAPATDSTEGSWLYEGQAGQIISLDMAIAGDGSDPYLSLTRLSDGFTVDENYGRGRIDPRILPADDLYRVIANLGNASGTFSVTLNLLEPSPLKLGESEESTLAADAIWTLEGRAGQSVSASVVTSDTAALPALSLLSSRGESLASAASDGATGSARIPSYVLRNDGPYFVRVEGLDARTPYQLRVDPVEPGELSVGQTVPSSTSGDTLWTLNAAPGQVVQINLTAEEGSSLDTIVRLFGPDGQQIAWDDDAGAGYNSALTLVWPDDQSYLVQADRYSDGSGAFSLAVAELEPEPLPVDGSSATILPDRAWTVDGEAGQVLTIDIVDTGADGYGSLQLVTADGALLASSGGGSQLAAILPQDGEYLLLPQIVADSGEDMVTASLADATPASNLDGLASQTLYNLALNNAIDQALALYAWGTTDRNVAFTADALNALCWHGAVYGALHGGADRVTTICEDLVDNGDTTDPYYLTLRHDIRGVARALTDNIPGAIEDFEHYVDSGGSYASQRQEWIDRLRAGEPVADVLDEATLRQLLLQ